MSDKISPIRIVFSFDPLVRSFYFYSCEGEQLGME